MGWGAGGGFGGGGGMVGSHSSAQQAGLPFGGIPTELQRDPAGALPIRKWRSFRTRPRVPSRRPWPQPARGADVGPCPTDS